jgi:hypothetical protein
VALVEVGVLKQRGQYFFARVVELRRDLSAGGRARGLRRVD